MRLLILQWSEGLSAEKDQRRSPIPPSLALKTKIDSPEPGMLPPEAERILKISSTIAGPEVMDLTVLPNLREDLLEK